MVELIVLIILLIVSLAALARKAVLEREHFKRAHYRSISLHGDINLLTSKSGQINFIESPAYKPCLMKDVRAKTMLQEVIFEIIRENIAEKEFLLKLEDKHVFLQITSEACTKNRYKRLTGEGREGFIFTLHDVSEQRYQQRLVSELQSQNSAWGFYLAHKVRGPFCTALTLLNMQREAQLSESEIILQKIENVLSEAAQDISKLSALGDDSLAKWNSRELDGKKWICIVDDDEDFLNQYELLFKSISPNIGVRSFTNVGDAAVYLSNSFENVVTTIVDYHIPGITGEIFIKYLKKEKINAGRIFLVTADETGILMNLVEDHTLDAESILRKPLEMDKINNIAYAAVQ